MWLSPQTEDLITQCNVQQCLCYVDLRLYAIWNYCVVVILFVVNKLSLSQVDCQSRLNSNKIIFVCLMAITITSFNENTIGHTYILCIIVLLNVNFDIIFTLSICKMRDKENKNYLFYLLNNYTNLQNKGSLRIISDFVCNFCTLNTNLAAKIVYHIKFLR